MPYQLPEVFLEGCKIIVWSIYSQLPTSLIKKRFVLTKWLANIYFQQISQEVLSSACYSKPPKLYNLNLHFCDFWSEIMISILDECHRALIWEEIGCSVNNDREKLGWLSMVDVSEIKGNKDSGRTCWWALLWNIISFIEHLDFNMIVCQHVLEVPF